MRKDGERDGAFLYYKTQKDRMTLLRLDEKSKADHDHDHNHDHEGKFLTRRERI